MMDILMQYGVSPTVDCRRAPGKNNDHAAWKLEKLCAPSAHNRLPQGSPLSPILYTILYNTSPVDLNQNGPSTVHTLMMIMV